MIRSDRLLKPREPDEQGTDRELLRPFVSREENELAIYSCPKCGMSVGTMTCGTCGKELVHDTLQLDGGASVDVAKCPDGHGKIKSPQCCGEDMSCGV